MAEIKQLKMPCPNQPCEIIGMVQVLVVADKETQPKIDDRANKKLSTELTKQHKEGQHG